MLLGLREMNHILFIEGNWFANDFTGLVPPWDDNYGIQSS